MTSLPPQAKIPGFVTDRNTFGKVVKDNPKDRIAIEIGDSKQDDFKPQFKFMRWDNEVNFSLRAEEHPSAVVETRGKVVKYKRPDYEVHMYEKPEMGEDGGFEFEWVLPSKPSTNVFTTTIQTKGLNFFYQPKLTAMEVSLGDERPDNVIGSYAVYHKTKGGMNNASGKEYKTGKAFHIYRPEAVDADGNREWCELNINESSGHLTVTVPQTFLDNATYPVVVDPTFGNTSIGASRNSTAANNVQGGYFTITESGDVTKLTAYGEDSSGTTNTKGLIVENSSPYNIVTNAVSNVVNVSTTTSWRDYAFSTSPSLTASTSYGMGILTESNYNRAYFDDFSGSGFYDSSNSYASPAALSAPSSNSRLYSIYATYTATGGTTFTPKVNWWS